MTTLKNSSKLKFPFAQKEITIDFIHDEDQELLDLNPLDRHIVSVKSHVFLNDASVFQYTESRHQVDKFQFTEFARRQKRWVSGRWRQIDKAQTKFAIFFTISDSLFLQSLFYGL